MIHTQHLSCQKISPGVPPTLTTVSIKGEGCSVKEAHHTHKGGTTVMSLHNCTSPTADGAGKRREGDEREASPETLTSLMGSLE